MRRAVRIARLAGGAGREFRRDRLTKDDRAGGPGECYACRITCGLMSSIDVRAVGSGHIYGVDHILDGQRHAMQRAAHRRAVRKSGLCNCLIGIEMFPRLDSGLEFRDPLEGRSERRSR